MMLWREHWSCIGNKRWKKSIINTLLGNGWSQYICAVIIVIVGGIYICNHNAANI